MAETAPVPAAPAAKAPRKKSSSRKKNPGSSVSDLILNIVTRSRDRKGVSVAALKKELAAGGYDVEKNKARIKIALKSLVDRQLIVQVKGIGASGSFKLNKTGTVKAPKKPGAKTKKSAAKRSAVTPAKAKKSPGQKPGVKKASRKVKRPPSAAAKKSGKSPKRAANKQRAGKKVNKSSPIKKRKPVRPKATKSKVNKKTSAKKK